MTRPYHDFDEQLAYSKRQAHDPVWEEVYRKAFPDFVSRESKPDDMKLQHKGIDSIIHLVSGRKLYVDEKMRPQYRDDIFLEYQHVYYRSGRTVPGWMEKPESALDYLAYAMKPKVCYVLPWQQLRKAWMEYKSDWFRMFNPVRAPNKDYWSYGLPVPTTDLLKAVVGAMAINLEAV